MRRRLLAAAAALLVLLGLGVAGCGDEAAGGGGRVTVLAAASLTDVLPRIAPEADYSFAGSDALAAQLREGAPGDVVVTASERLSQELHAAGLVDRPRVFATGRLALAVPAGGHAVATLADLGRPGVAHVIAAEGVPLGDYTRELLAALGREELVEGAASFEHDARDVLAKVALGEADAGIVYATDVAAARGAVRAVPLPASVQPPVRYAIATVPGTTRRPAAEALVARVLGPEGLRRLRLAGFGPP